MSLEAWMKIRKGEEVVSTWKIQEWRCIITYYYLEPETSVCFIWMIPDLYLGNGCFTKHPFKTGCLGYQGVATYNVYMYICFNIWHVVFLLPRLFTERVPTHVFQLFGNICGWILATKGVGLCFWGNMGEVSNDHSDSYATTNQLQWKPEPFISLSSWTRWELESRYHLLTLILILNLILVILVLGTSTCTSTCTTYSMLL